MKVKVAMAAQKKATKKSTSTYVEKAMKGRNKFQKKCFVCGQMVKPFCGYLKKDKLEYKVHHIECKPTHKAEVIAEDESQFLGSNLLRQLEAKLVDRKLKGEPIILLPKIIEHIEELEKKVGFHMSITGDRTCKNCGECRGALDQ